MTRTQTTHHALIEAAFGRPHHRIPVWLMRQAGRYLPEYREVRKQHTFLDMCHNPEVAAEVTLQPVRRFDLDAAIVFSDILVFLPELGLPVEFPEGGPRVGRPIRTPEDVERLGRLDTSRHIPEIYDAVSLCALRLDGSLPLFGFCGAPFTLACYAIEGQGSKEFSAARGFLHRHERAGHRLLETLAEAAASHLVAQVKAGAAAVQVFDTWAGLLGRRDFEEFSRPYIERIVTAVKPLGVPVFVFARGVPAEWQAGLGAHVHSLDWRADLAEARRVLAPAGLQGNLDPVLLASSKSKAAATAAAIGESMRDALAYVFNLGHGVLPETPVENVAAVIDAVHQVKLTGSTR
jgi:uroporphyrinogen decarboxylase